MIYIPPSTRRAILADYLTNGATMHEICTRYGLKRAVIEVIVDNAIMRRADQLIPQGEKQDETTPHNPR